MAKMQPDLSKMSAETAKKNVKVKKSVPGRVSKISLTYCRKQKTSW